VSAQHTPGPWQYDTETATVVAADGCTTIAGIDLDARVLDAADANGLLMAAAPALVEAMNPDALEAIADAIAHGNPGACAHSLRALARMQRAALARAGIDGP
jgi:hypothetical protein